LNGEVEAFFATKGSATKRVYKAALNYFLEFYQTKHGEDKTLSTFLDELDKNMKLPRRQRRRLSEEELNGYISFLQEKKMSNNSIRAYVAGLQNFLKYYSFQVSTAFVKVPSNKVAKKNKKHAWKLVEIQEFVKVANSMRDKAVILCLFQSGLGIQELVNLNYEDVAKELEGNKLPLMLHLTRQKTGIDFKTFLGRDSIKYLKLYLQTRSGLRHDSPLFTLQGSNNERLTTGAIEKKFRDFATEVSFIQEYEMEGYNPIRPHSLRSAFRSRLTGRTDPSLIEFLMGHSIGAEKRAYINLPDEELRELYANHEHLLSIEKTSKEELSEQREVKVPYEHEQRINRLETLLNEREKEIREIDARLRRYEEKREILNTHLEELDRAMKVVVDSRFNEGGDEFDRKVIELELLLNYMRKKESPEDLVKSVKEVAEEYIAEAEEHHKAWKKEKAELLES
jgi:integrase/recombinase XerD